MAVFIASDFCMTKVPLRTAFIESGVDDNCWILVSLRFLLVFIMVE